MFAETDTRDNRVSCLIRLGKADQEFIHALYLEHSPKLRRCAVKLGFRGETVDDILQDTFLAAMRRFDALRECQNPRAYLFQILRNVIGDRIRSAKNAERLWEELQRHQDDAKPKEYLDELPPEVLYRGLIGEDELQLLLSVYLEGRPVKELASELGIDTGACYMRLKRAKEHLRAAIEKDSLR